MMTMPMQRSTQGPKYDLRINPVYQVDWQNEATGKHVSATKRRVRWRFGFSNRQALEQGLTGVDCRGEEHEVVLIWSLTSGKRLVIVDGQEVHFSFGRRTDAKFENSWSMFGGHIFKVVAHASSPLFNEPGFRQFDLFMDGMSFHSFPKIYELGKHSYGDRRSVSSVNTSHRAENYEYAAPVSTPTHRPSAAPRAVTPDVSPKQMTKQVEAPRTEPAPQSPVSPASFEDLLSGPSNQVKSNDLLWDSAPQIAYAPQPTHYYQQQQALTVYGQQPQASPYHHQQNSPDVVADEFTPVSPPPRTFQDVSKEILKHYTPDPSVPALTYTPHYSEQAYQSHSGSVTQEDASAANKETVSGKPHTMTILKPTMQPLSIVEMEERNEAPVSPFEKAVKTLVNLDDLSETLETPEQAKAARLKAQNQPPKSKPLPPRTPEWNLGLRPVLADIRQHAQAKAVPKKEIMRTHAFDANAARAGMMVVYGSSIPAVSGFGAGVHQSHYGSYFPQQQRLYKAY